MKQTEKQEIEKLPAEYRPIGAWAYFGYMILYSLPLVGIIALIAMAVAAPNVNARSYARSYFCSYLLMAVIILILFLTGGGIMLLDYIRQMIGANA